MGCGVFYQQLNEVERALSTMRRFGISELDESYKALFGVQGKLLAQIGFKFPRTILQLLKLAALSPGSITLWHDVESGWMAEARTGPGAPPVYHRVSDEVAVKLIKKELTPELEKELMTPDDYIGE
jgi:hypothetical protein